MAGHKLTKELFNERYGKWIDKMYKDYFYPLVSLNNMEIAEYLGVSRETITKFFKLGYLNREQEFIDMFKDYEELSFNIMAQNVEKSEVYLRRHYRRIYGTRLYKIKCKATDPRTTERSKKVGRNSGYVRYLWQRLHKYLYTYKRIDTNKLIGIFGSKQVYYNLFKALKAKGYIIETRRIDGYNFEYIYHGKGEENE